jgi:signal peptidase I
MKYISRMTALQAFLAAVMSAAALEFPALAAAPRRNLTMRMLGESMVPTLRNDQVLQVDTAAYVHVGPGRGDIVVFHAPAFGPRMPLLIKRVVGLPNEVIGIHGGNVYINGHTLHEPYHPSRAGYRYPAHRIPPGSYFLLGDNRNNSEDSHLIGTIPRYEIVGKVLHH